MKKLTIVDPFNDDYINKLKEFELENLIDTKTLSYIQSIRNKMTKEEYDKLQYLNNDFQQIITLEEKGKITDYCHIQAEKDRKTCHIVLSPIQKKNKKRYILESVTEYAFDILGMNDVFLTEITENETLTEKGFCCLGESNGNIIYLKQKEDVEENKKVI